MWAEPSPNYPLLIESPPCAGFVISGGVAQSGSRARPTEWVEDAGSIPAVASTAWAPTNNPQLAQHRVESPSTLIPERSKWPSTASRAPRPQAATR